MLWNEKSKFQSLILNSSMPTMWNLGTIKLHSIHPYTLGLFWENLYPSLISCTTNRFTFRKYFDLKALNRPYFLLPWCLFKDLYSNTFLPLSFFLYLIAFVVQVKSKTNKIHINDTSKCTNIWSKIQFLNRKQV